MTDCKNCKYTDEYCASDDCEQTTNNKFQDRFTYRIPVIKNNEFDGFVYVRLGDKIPELHGGHYGRPEQCLGKKDFRGKPIYEGDIFQAEVLNSFEGDDYEGKMILGQISYYEDQAVFPFASYSPINLGKISIIGNIHEDKHLLGETENFPELSEEEQEKYTEWLRKIFKD